ncbi:unnamed protein product [Cylindrotheca closterium]|uniref:SLC26A/SulP transporter domain-containing protein n=1 Tax=Cylindrotheca closterium TaxID=2856 RepID=A0AAD2GC01_9STRA|nr:unnamed protein product [Cylindrotheca closterium]
MEESEQTTDSSYSFLSKSFESGGNFLRNYEQHDTKWDLVSPMTQRVILNRSTAPTQLKRRRSQSFNDFIDIVATETSSLLPPTKSVQLPHHHISEPLIGHADTQNGKHQPQQHEQNNDPEQQKELTGPQEAKLIDEPPRNPAWICVLFGVINASIVIPVVMSFGNIIYQNAAFAPYMPVLIKLTMVSGVVHQLCFSTFSSLPFAVGSVQDAGLIFLSSMASDMVVYCRQQGYNDEVMLATVTVGLGLAAALLGLGLVVVGKLRLAGYVQMLPICVVAGYLAYIGLFCGKAGIILMAGGRNGLSFPKLVVDNYLFIAPGIAGGLFIYYSVRKLKHVAVLPTTILLLFLIFYASLSMSGCTLKEATEDGWIRKAEPSPVWYRTWDYIQPSLVAWSALPRLLLTELSMIFVVALSSSLDVAAIELEVKRPLNYNKELIVVGISNMVSGLTGGYTGSYIFSQSIFTLRAGIRERLPGFVLAFCQLAVIVIPFPILAYVPNFFYGSLLFMICLDLMYDWLWDIRTKVTKAEYLIGLATFVLIQLLEVEYGIIAGVILYVVCRKAGVDVGELKIATTEDGIEQ